MHAIGLGTLIEDSQVKERLSSPWGNLRGRAKVRRSGAGTSRAQGPWGSTDLTGTDNEPGGGGTVAADRAVRVPLGLIADPVTSGMTNDTHTHTPNWSLHTQNACSRNSVAV